MIEDRDDALAQIQAPDLRDQQMLMFTTIVDRESWVDYVVDRVLMLESTEAIVVRLS